MSSARAWPAIRHRIDAEPQPHEAALLDLDCGKAREHLGWRPVWDAGRTVAAWAG